MKPKTLRKIGMWMILGPIFGPIAIGLLVLLVLDILEHPVHYLIGFSCLVWFFVGVAAWSGVFARPHNTSQKDRT